MFFIGDSQPFGLQGPSLSTTIFEGPPIVCGFLQLFLYELFLKNVIVIF